MRKQLLTVLAISGVLIAAPAMADRRHHQEHRYSGHRDYYVEYRRAPRYAVPVRYVEYEYERPPHYHYEDRHYVAHHGDCDHAFLWIGGAMVLSEILHHAHDGH